jgi:predicted Holliday junction resolvase-like endonuclease
MFRKGNILLTVLSTLVLLLVVVNIVLALGNQSIQAEVSERQQMLTQTMQLENLNRQLIGVMANLALKTNDEQLKKLLAESGVNLGPAETPNPAPAKK